MARVERRYTIQTCDPSVSRTAVRWGPRFSSSAPPQIPRSFLRSFSLWARHSAETSAVQHVLGGAAVFLLVASRQRGGGGGGGGKVRGGRRGGRRGRGGARRKNA